MAVGSTEDGMRMLSEIGAKVSEDIYVKSSQPQFALIFGYDWLNTSNMQVAMMADESGSGSTGRMRMCCRMFLIHIKLTQRTE